MPNKKHDAEQKPLMYIVQPDYAAAEANMQDILIKRKKPLKQRASEDKAKQKEEQPEAQSQQEKEIPEAVRNKEADRPSKGIKPIKKPLSKMTIIEKINFLTSLPGNMPKTLCLIEANGKTYRGTLIAKKGESVFVRTSSKGEPAELAIDSITSLHPLGF
ncbi:MULTISPECIES: CotO family spore coat protein [Bacillus]|uniref:CotO family spore coat protein n=1 Tax=Bacillus glycinifermentans TaxID=1664069 RepID=A0A0T6BNP9_9BACI|nr:MULTISPECIES: CotO family spore coat protein [Bacillus]ATH95090.1 spore coat protein CotO [Bacillus glycinifermentans]KKB73322.1 CotO [Bacillus sp. TH008]KRT93281.1 spore coat protein CotO [Bacillus glycinifermentans]MDU0069528.1 CotO family spore coat protein [Bacillus sp. IG6]MEC0487535.1 CotO family spore coat protein [Bacillus glycinifermentans]